MNTAPFGDMTLVEKMQAGDTDAFNTLMNEHRPYITRICQHYTHHQNMVDDLVQITMLKVWRFRNQFKKKSNFKTWLFTITVHAVRDADRTETRHHKGRVIENEDEEHVIDNVSAPYSSTSELAEFKDTLSIINIAFTELSTDHRTIFRLSFIERLSYSEIARKCDISVGTVSSRIYYVRQYILGLLASAG